MGVIDDGQPVRVPQNREWRWAGMSFLNRVPPLGNAPAQPVEAGAEISGTAGFGPGFANPALVGYAEAARSGAGRRRFRKLT